MNSLHTKHRPLTFDGVIGQPSVVSSLKKVVADKRAHSFLFTGPAGTGKTTLARILATTFAAGKGTVANLMEVDAAANSGAEAMREIALRANYRAVGASGVKAIIVDEAHRLSGTAWDVLLKPIEEPPKHVYWMLCSTNPGKIPKTIQTRCLKYDLKLVSEDDLFKLLVTVAEAEKLEIEDDILEAIADGAAGSPRQALVFLEACVYAENAGEARQIMRSAGQSREAIELCRFLVRKQGRSWADAMKILRGLDGVADAESIRIIVVNYLQTALLDTKGEQQARPLLGLLECFDTPYSQSDRMAPLLQSLGLALGLDR